MLMDPVISAFPPPSGSVLSLLAGAEALSAERERRRLFQIAADCATRFLGSSYGLFFAVRFIPPDLSVGLLGCCVADGVQTPWSEACEASSWLPVDPLLAECLRTDHGIALAPQGDGWRVAFALGGLGNARWVLELSCPTAPDGAACTALGLFLRCLENQLQQWEYTNLDTLTRLLNRKTFDDDFERLIAAAELAEQARKEPPERRELSCLLTQPCWLGVVDIDHFKKINDNFGHLFGDEVLLRVADLMRQSFRSHDKLFRFGGEEFVVMLRNVSEDRVGAIFDRFRVAVEEHDFPRVGQVRCSVGYARIDPALSPAELLGRADEALYYSKDHGRNQVNGFDELVMSGKLKLSAPAGQAEIQSDIDDVFF